MKKIYLVLISLALILTSCSPYKSDDVLFEYEDYGVVYYLKSENEKYKYSDYIIDDVSNGSYKKATPNIADYKNGTGLLDYDIPAYVDARLNYTIKVEIIKKHEFEVDDICSRVHDDSFEYKKSYIYMYDKNTQKSVKLCESPVTNISYDDAMPSITFDVETEESKKVLESYNGRKIKLSDIIAANSTIEGFMKVLLSQGKEKQKFFLDRRIDNDEMFDLVATISEIGVK